MPTSVLTALALAFTPVLAETAPIAEPQSFAVRQAASPIKVDGSLDEPAWGGATVIPVDKEWFPGDNAAPPVATDCLVTYDADNLYVAFRAKDPAPGVIRAHLADRDTPFLDDTVGFMIDPFNDRRRAFQFRVNPLGVQMDATNNDVDGSEDWAWDTIWETSARVVEDGYVVETRIPFSSLRFPRGSSVSQTWGFLATRDYPRSTRYRMRSMATDRDKSCLICQFDRITGLTGITPGRNLEFDPTLTALRSDMRPDGPNGTLAELAGNEIDHGGVHPDAGLTVRWGITPNVTANAAINPDFSGVEADAAQLDINTRFALFFPEKRPFFLEGADFFSTPIRAVFTRTIADPGAGLKVTGKEGPSAFGVFLANDSINNLIIPANQGSDSASIDQHVRDAVLRYRHDVGKTSTLGVLYTSRDAQSYFNRVGGIDGSVRFSDSDSMRFQYLMSSTDYPDSFAADFGQKTSPFTDKAFSVGYNHGTRKWGWFGDYQDRGRDFRADSGFIPQVDTRFAGAGITRTFYGKPDSWLNRLDIRLSGDHTEDHDRNLTNEGQDLFVSYQGPLQSYVEAGLSPNREYFDGVTYNDFRQSFYGEFSPSGSLNMYVAVNTGETIDFVNSQQARQLRLNPGINYSLGRRLRGEISHVFQRLRVDDGELFTARLTQGRLIFHFNQRTFVRLIVQDTSIDRNVRVYDDPNSVDPQSRRVFTQLLFSYKVNPQTLILVGYSDTYLGGEDAGPSPMPVDLTQQQRAFFVKLGYAWVL